MSRLTILQKNGITNMVCKNEDCHTAETYCPCTITDQCDCPTLKVVIEKLAHYEDLEEQGLLLELPCKVGERVYMIQHRYTKCSKHQEYRDEYNCQGCEELVCDSHIEHYIQPLNSVPIDWIVKMDNQFGKTVFLTKEEAEKALAELKGNDND